MKAMKTSDLIFYWQFKNILPALMCNRVETNKAQYTIMQLRKTYNNNQKHSL